MWRQYTAIPVSFLAMLAVGLFAAGCNDEDRQQAPPPPQQPVPQQPQQWSPEGEEPLQPEDPVSPREQQ